MPSMILTKASMVRGQPRAPGYVFDVSDKEARLWAALGHAKATSSDQSETAQPSSSDGVPARADRKGNARYNRRDMRAED